MMIAALTLAGCTATFVSRPVCISGFVGRIPFENFQEKFARRPFVRGRDAVVKFTRAAGVR
jgi:hypothetical protein